MIPDDRTKVDRWFPDNDLGFSTDEFRLFETMILPSSPILLQFIPIYGIRFHFVNTSVTNPITVFYSILHNYRQDKWNWVGI
ncbi:hypothetical protein L6452_39827 [Arctium lappa]|uniref:Uncharacterized protein n=1 Tax=Arctium lappa TaxID=4217 RepID=A0ACB8XU78_ARCLA|nr:hypothetical protein L6452_39827 [Arctium lappa]